MKTNRVSDALELLERAIAAHRDNAELLLTRAMALAMADQEARADKAAAAIEARWPEWDRAYVFHGLLLERAGRKEEARQKLQTAVWLGSGDAAATCALARLSSTTPPGRACACPTSLKNWVTRACPEG